MPEINPAETEHNSAPINFGNLALILGCALILVTITFMKSGFHISFKLGQKTETKKYTYAQAQAEALAELGASEDASADVAKSENQIAMVDPGSNAGAVLGASTGTEDSILPDAKEMFTQEVLNSIKINLSQISDVDSVKQYKREVDGIESSNNAELILADLTSTDSKILLQIPKRVQPLIADLMQVSVPKDLEEYHKFKLIYYMELSALAEGYAGVATAPDPKDTGLSIFSVVDRLQRLASDVQNKFGIQL